MTKYDLGNSTPVVWFEGYILAGKHLYQGRNKSGNFEVTI